MASLRDADGLFPSASLTSSGRPVLLPSEVERHLLSGVDLEASLSDSQSSSSSFVPYKCGVLILTNHRLLWILSASNEAIAIPLSSVMHIFEFKKSIKSMFHSPRIRFQTLCSSSRTVIVTAVIRSKGTSGSSSDVEAFYSKLWECWRARAWEDQYAETEKEKQTPVASSSKAGIYSGDGSVRMIGVSGILRKEQEAWESTDKSLQDAFQDLSALMSKAKEMMTLAEKMRQKLLMSSTDDEMGSKEEMQDWLLSVGIISPVTKESAGALYHQQLSRQLADFASTHLERSGGMLNLIDVYCIFNRARGTELISPEDLLQACNLWQKFNVPVMLRKLDSGVMVVQTKSHTDDEIIRRIKELVTKQDGLRSGVTASGAAMALRMAPAMAKEFLQAAEGKGILCRDISADGLCFYINIFHDISLYDLFLVNTNGAYSSWVKAQSAS